MGYTIQLQWSYTPPPGRPTPLADIVLPRVLEHYGLHTPTRSTLQLRTYRAQFPSSSTSNPSNVGSSTSTNAANAAAAAAQLTNPSSAATHSRYLTSITTLPGPSLPSIPGIPLPQQNQLKDDTAYLFLDDRSPPPKPQPSSNTADDLSGTAETTTVDDGQGTQSELNERGKERTTDDAKPTSEQMTKHVDGGGDVDMTGEQNDSGSGNSMDDDGFEIIDIPKSSTPTPGPGAPTSENQVDVPMSIDSSEIKPNVKSVGTSSSGSNKGAVNGGLSELQQQRRRQQQWQRQQQHERFRCIVVRPAHNVGPMLQNLLSPFVMGLTKSARAAASTTSSLPTPTPLSGSTLLLTRLTFLPLDLPLPQHSLDDTTSRGHDSNRDNDGEADGSVVLRMFILPNPNAGSIFLEAEYLSSSSSSAWDNNNINNKYESSSLPTSPSSKGGNLTTGGGQATAATAARTEHGRRIERVLREFLEGCLVEGLEGEKKWINLDPEANADAELSSNTTSVRDLEAASGRWDGLERNKRSTFALARTLRESGFI